MRKCRYRLCGRAFAPLKPNYWFCTYEHAQLHYAQNDYRGYKRSRDASYDRGFHDGLGAVAMPLQVWKGLILFAHPDKYAQEPGLQALADEVTRWLLEHRPAVHGAGKS